MRGNESRNYTEAQIANHPLLLLGDDVAAATASAERAGYGVVCVGLEGGMVAAMRELDRIGEVAGVLACPPAEAYLDIIGAGSLRAELWTPGANAVQAVAAWDALQGIRTGPGLRAASVAASMGMGGRIKARLPAVVGGLLPGPRAWERVGEAGEAGEAGEPYFREVVTGAPHEAAVWSDGWSATVLGVVRVVGVEDAVVGVEDAVVVAFDEPLRSSLSGLAVGLTQRFDLRGLWGMDLRVEPGGGACVMSVLPRYPQCLRELERATNRSLLRGRAR